MPKHRTTKLSGPYQSTKIRVFWFVQVDEEQKKSIVEALNQVLQQIINKKPELERRSIASVPWLRNYPPSLADVFDTARGFEMGEGHVLGIDAQSLEDESLLVLHCVNEKEPEIGRAGREDAIAIHLVERPYRNSLAELFDERPWTRIQAPMNTVDPVIGNDDIKYTLPPHIPSDTRIKEDKIILFSLVKLADAEISALRQDLGDTAQEITIYNWPHDIPASQTETYNIFQFLKPDLVLPCVQTFVMFIDATHLSGPERSPVVVVACESMTDGTDIHSEQERMRYEHIYMHAEEAQQVKHLWPLIWNPPKLGSGSDSRINHPLFYGSSHPSFRAVTTPGRNSAIMGYHSHYIAKPGAAIEALGPQGPGFVVYIICPITPEEARKLRNIVVDENRGAVQFLELNLVPRRPIDRYEEHASQQRSTDTDSSLDPLLEFFDSPGYRSMANPPFTFVFLDNNALEILLGGTEHPSVPLAHLHYHYHIAEGDSEDLAIDEPAYLHASFPIDDGLGSALVNLAVGNLFFWELANMYSDGIGVAFWPEYMGSMTRDMLNIDEN